MKMSRALGLSLFLFAGPLVASRATGALEPGGVGRLPSQAVRTPTLRTEQSITSPAPFSASRWWSPGDGGALAAYVTYPNTHGQLGILNTSGAINTKGHPFFEPIGENGRACVSCHQPANAMSLSVAAIQERWKATRGKDPIFAPVDGMNCPDLPRGDPTSHSLLLERGLIRVFLPWPPKAADGTVVEPEFTIEVVRDPTGCNTSVRYGLNSPAPTISVYRRPRPVANTKYLTHHNFGVFAFVGKGPIATVRDPETGLPTSMNMMADARVSTLKAQAVSAAQSHLEFRGVPDEARLRGIVDFESQVFAAQANHRVAGDLMEPSGPPGLGVRNVANGRPGVLGNNTTAWVFPVGDVWKKLPPSSDSQGAERNRMRESIARGHDVYMFRTFWIRDVMHLTTVGLGNPTKRTCSTCHGMHMTGMDVANGWMDLGTTNLPWATEEPQNPWTARKPQMPLFKITCKSDVAPHAFLGRSIYTQDPGRALITGKCHDVGSIVMQQFRGLASRAPYFANGSAASLRELVDFYDRRFNIGFTDQERDDLINFLSAL
jgi:hypothetical protein